MKGPLIDILLATYQGCEFLEEQIESIFSQTYPYFRLIIRDDGSTDASLPFLKKLALAHPSQVQLLPNVSNGGIVNNFSNLLAASQAPYICFCDQDDKWYKNKLEWTFETMQMMEAKAGKEVPLLVHSDLTVSSKDLNIIHPSFWGYTHLNPHQTSLNRLLVQNCLTGCTMMLNRPLADLANPIPLEVPMHDWWVALVAACFGQIGVVERPTLSYRQHGRNDTGAKKYALKKIFNEDPAEKEKNQRSIQQTYQQAKILLERFANRLDLDTIQLLHAYSSLESSSFVSRPHKIINHGFYKHGFLRNFKWLLNI
ncbi:MAG: glycosyltransferase family 2 protein [Parachlamydia sp.]|jgi:glycosyltransferase involved in cell wall biosynthesis|nr:glycosyltransferase family 2 protein [Parachlamydia sp.]